jgi:hypothetical protein
MSNGAEARALNALQEYRNARAENDADKEDQAGDRFNDFIMFVEDEDRRNELMAIFNALVEADAENIFVEFAKVARGFGEVKDAFEMGEKMAEEGKNDLFFPSAATELAKMAGAFKELKAAAEKVIDEIDDLEVPFKKKDGKALVDEGEQVKDALQELMEKLEEMRDALPD